MKTWVKALLASSLALGPAAAFAAIDNTHHDVPYLGQLGNERCAFCHSKTNVAQPTDPTLLGKVGNFCVQVCHQGAGTVFGRRANVRPSSPGVFNYTAGAFSMSNADITAAVFYAGHGRQTTALDVNFPGQSASIEGTGWPYTQVLIDEMQCTSCHAVHDATHPPFLNGRLSAGANDQTNGFCTRCHPSDTRTQSFADSVGDHPTEFEWDPTAAGTRNTQKGATGTWMNGREIVANPAGLGITNLLVTPTGLPGADGAVEGAMNDLAASWNLGGHVINAATGLPRTGAAVGEMVGCYSCHTVHVTATATNQLANTLLASNSLVNICYGCHTMEPGMTGFGHPIGEDVPLNKALGWDAVPLSAAYNSANWNGRSAAIFKPAAHASKGVNAPFCITCHDVHGAATGRMAVRIIGDGATLVNAYALTDAVCETCHNGNGSTAEPNPNAFGNPSGAGGLNKHHPGATFGSTYDYVADDGFIANTAWRTPDGLGDLADGLTCGDCHVGDGTTTKRATAHNWQ